MKTLRNLVCIAVGILAPTLSVHAAPYASSCTNLNSSTIVYYLNAAPAAGSVTVTTYPSGGHPTLSPASPVQGANTFVIGTGSSLSSDTSYSITCTKTGTGTPSAEAIASANIPQTSWGGQPDPRGVAVNCYPTNGPSFGCVYMANAAAYSVSGNNRSKGLGILPCHSDMSYAFGATTAGLGSASFSGGSSGSAPYKLSISRYDGSVVVGSIDPVVGGVVQFNPYMQSPTTLLPKGQNTSGSATSPYHGEIYGAPKTTGTLANGNLVLYTFDYTMPTPATVTSAFGGLKGAIGINSAYYNTAYKTSIITTTGEWENVCRYTLNGTAPASALPDLTINYGSLGLLVNDGLPGDMDVNPTNGYIYTTSERAGAGSAPYLNVFSANGATNLYCSAASATVDNILTLHNGSDGSDGDSASCLVRISPDGKYLALSWYYGPMSVFTLTNGIPDLSTYTFIDPELGVTAPRGIDWDMADNIYNLNSGEGILYIYDLGNTEVCTTSNDITSVNGSWSLTGPPAATITATTPIAYQANNSYVGNGGTPTPGVFTINLSYALSSSQKITFNLGGTATNNTTYTLTSSAATASLTSSPYSITFPANTTSETITVTPNTGSAYSAPTLTSIITLTGAGASYSTPSPNTATVSIANSGPQELLVSGVGPASTMYRGLPNDFVTFSVARWGDTNVSGTINPSSFALTGSATYGTDYQGGPQPVSYSTVGSVSSGSPITVNLGDTSELVEVGLPLAHGSFTGNETVILSAGSPSGTGGMSGFTFGPGTATAMLLDNLYPPETDLWADSLTTASDSVNWTLCYSIETGLAGWYFAGPLAGASGPGPIFHYNNTPPSDFSCTFGYNPDGQSGVAYDFVSSPPGVTIPGGDVAAPALRMTVNKQNAVGAVSSGLNCYPVGSSPAGGFSNNYAFRFSMQLAHGCNGSVTTEYAVFGINHYGTNVNWWQGNSVPGSGANTFSYTNTDGIWFCVSEDPAGSGNYGGFPADFLMFTATNSGVVGYTYPSSGNIALNGAAWSSYTNVFKNPIDFSSESQYLNPEPTFANWNNLAAGYGNSEGTPANISGWYTDAYSSGSCGGSGTAGVPYASSGGAYPIYGSLYPQLPSPIGGQANGPWVDVEIKQYNISTAFGKTTNVVTMSIDKTAIFTWTNTSVFQGGYPMLGYFDPYSSEGNGGGVYYANARVVSLAGPTITSVTPSGTSTVIQFTSVDPNDLPSYFTVMGSTTVNGTYSKVASTIMQSGEMFSATVTSPVSGNMFYVILENNASQ